MKFATRLVSFDVSPADPHRPMSTPIYQTATFEQLQADSFGEYDYSRSGNPTRKVLEDQIAALEDGIRGFCFSSGMSAIATVTHLLKAGDEILADWDLYGGVSRLFGKVLNRSGIGIRYVDASDPDSVARQVTPATRLIYVESPTNPFLRVIDLRAIAAVAREHGALFCVDNSTMSPYLQNPLTLGADIVLHSATKFLCGHSDVTAGTIVVKDQNLADEIYFLQNAEGTALGPFDCFLLLRGLKTLKLRVDTQQRNAEVIAEFLSLHPKVSSVYYPGLSTHRDFSVQQAQARGGGAVLSFTVNSHRSAKQIAESSKLFCISVSFGSVNSTISIPLNMSHASVPIELRASRALPDNLLRLSVGIEDHEDLIQDLSGQLEVI
ncbi:PLP-dependent aspartate aminotransferase family protein [Granulicella sp. L60]|uniref:trans-sulfuration enzyme family protein n=1 Tax=Granulicella sp. L60 TaxID=1641866 RepID=UPI00131B53FD|nr:PLP-dependent aspartate aminotransferase family protein [Granulicella sp. L60]